VFWRIWKTKSSFSSSATRSPTKYFKKMFWFFRTNCWSEIWVFPFHYQII